MVCPSLARTPIQPLPGGASKYNTHILSWVHCGSILCCGWLAYCVLQWVAVSCSVLQCVAVCCSVLWMTSILCCDWVVECVAIEWCIVLCLCTPRAPTSPLPGERPNILRMYYISFIMVVYCVAMEYGVATISRLLKIIGLLCRIVSFIGLFCKRDL